MSKRFTVLDSFRGLFAFVVAIYHYEKSGPIGQMALFRRGDYFVDFFFVLNGFIIYHTYNQLSMGEPQIRFMKNRLYRLYPLHVFMLLIFLVMETGKYVLYGLGLFRNPVFDRSNMTTFIYNVFFAQSFALTPAGWNYPSWSISAEMVAYTVFCFVIVRLNRYTLTVRSAGFLTISLLSLALVYLVKGNGDIKMTYDFGMLRCMYGFFVGCLTYEIYRLVSGNKWFRWQQVTMLEITVLSTSLIATSYLPAKLSFFLPLLFAVCILVFAFEAGAVTRGLSNKFLGRVGELSYSIYMTHAAIAIVFEVVLNIAKVRSTMGLTVALAVYLITIYYVSTLTHQYIEIKLRKWLQNRLNGEQSSIVLRS